MTLRSRSSFAKNNTRRGNARKRRPKSSSSFRLMKISTAGSVIWKRKAESCPFQDLAGHIAQYSPATTECVRPICARIREKRGTGGKTDGEEVEEVKPQPSLEPAADWLIL
jgi:hypothetical protein